MAEWMKGLLYRIKRKWMKIRLQPIRVYCLHHVCVAFDAESMNSGDWMQIDDFKRKVTALQKSGVKFITLSEAYAKIENDKFRIGKYAVITADDGYATLKEVLSWLEKQRIPIALFINGKYLDGKSYRNNPKEKYLTKEDIWGLNSPLIEIGSHGWEHTDASKISIDEFKKSMEQNLDLLTPNPRYIPFHAYTWGRFTTNSDNLLASYRIIPVLIDGEKNYNDHGIIHRELLK